MTWDDKLGVAVMLVGGLVQLAVHPVKTYRLVRYGRGWYE